jgi:PAS domain S-box-containing protein
VTIFISAISHDVRNVFYVAAVACILYGFLEYQSTGVFMAQNTNFLVRFPFLFLAAAMSGYLAMEGKKSRDENTRLMDMNQFLADQADATTMKLTEINRNLKSLLEYYHCVLASIQTGIIVVHSDGKVRTFNSGARQITGFVEAEIAKKTLEELPEQLKPVAEALRGTLRDGKTYLQDHLDLRTTRSETVPVTLETSVLKGSNGAVIGAIATLKDITLLRQMETQLVRAERLSALGEMVSGVAHEIKNPLNAILGFSKRLSDKLTEPNLKKYADIIATEVLRMDTTVNDVLEYTRSVRLSRTPEDVNAFLENALTLLAEKLEKGGVKVVREFAGDLPKIPIDANKTRQVILNFILNAIQAMPNGGTLTLRTRLLEGMVPQGGQGENREMVLQQLFLQQQMAAVSIQDTGTGIAKENLSKLFHPFFTTKTTGTGLGLSICQKIIAAHGGMIDVQSTLGTGTTFTFCLPLVEG